MAQSKDNGLYGMFDKVTGKIKGVGSKKELKDQIDRQKLKQIISENYNHIQTVLEEYIDMSQEHKHIISLWVLGTYFHDEFESYPYLFLNAMRGSGKTRALKLITKLSKNGQVMASPTEAVLFRTEGALGIDEFEDVGKKDKSSVRELLNASYKKGIKIARMKKKKSEDGEQLVVEEFEPYRPIIMANIWGMDEVLGDRCISLVLEKSNNPLFTKKVEDFDNHNIIKHIQNTFSTPKNTKKCSLCSVVTLENIYKAWNNYITQKYSPSTLYTYSTQLHYTTLTTLLLPQQQKIDRKEMEEIAKRFELDKLFDRIDSADIEGRNLELYLPLFLISSIISDKSLLKTIDIAKGMVKEKRHEEETESCDVTFLEYISTKQSDLEFYRVKDLTNEFKQSIEDDDDETKWLNSKWVGRALKRLLLITQKRRTAKGMEVMLNIKKAHEKLKMFRYKNETPKTPTL